MAVSRRRLLQSLGATAVTSGIAGCSFGRGNMCPSVEDSLDTTVDDTSRTGLGPLTDAWPMRYNDAAATGYTDAPGPQSDVERRRLFTGEGSFFPSVVVGNSRVYVTSRRAELLALDPVDGSIDWRYEQLGTGGASAAVTDEFVLLASRNGLHAVDAATGDQQWVLDESADSEGLVLVEDGTVYANTWDGIVAVAIETGEVLWRVGGHSLGAVADGRVYTSDDTGLQVVDAADGHDLWHNEDVDGLAVAVRDGTVYTSTSADTHFANEPGRVYGLDTTDGSQQWRVRNPGAESSNAPAVAPGVLVLGSGYGGTVHALNRANGQQRWCADFGIRRVVTPAIGDNVLYVMAADVIQARRLDDGVPLWTSRVAADEQLGRDEEEPEFYHRLALSGDVLLAVGYGRRGLAVDAFVEH